MGKTTRIPDTLIVQLEFDDFMGLHGSVKTVFILPAAVYDLENGIVLRLRVIGPVKTHEGRNSVEATKQFIRAHGRLVGLSEAAIAKMTGSAPGEE